MPEDRKVRANSEAEIPQPENDACESRGDVHGVTCGIRRGLDGGLSPGLAFWVPFAYLDSSKYRKKPESLVTS